MSGRMWVGIRPHDITVVIVSRWYMICALYIYMIFPAGSGVARNFLWWGGGKFKLAVLGHFVVSDVYFLISKIYLLTHIGKVECIGLSV